jgi:hypothetical protein
MAYQEKNAIVNIISTVLISMFFWLYVFQRYQEEIVNPTNIFKFWGTAFLTLVIASIVFQVVMTVVFNVINTIVTQEEEDPSFVDERDQLIELKATRNAMYLFSAGVALSMAILVIDMPPSAMFILLILSGMVGELFGNVSRLYFYRRGF